MKGLLGKKLGMTQVFRDNGDVVSVTAIKAGPCVVIQKKTEEKDGYNSLKLGFEDINGNKLNKPELGQFESRNLEPKKHVREIRDFTAEYDEGDEVTVDLFEEGEKVEVTGFSKGHGFTGNIKRWNHSTGPKTHGSRFYRAPGSVGSTGARRVLKGHKLPGRMGKDKSTLKNLEIVKIDTDRDVLLIKGSVPGPDKNLLTIKKEN